MGWKKVTVSVVAAIVSSFLWMQDEVLPSDAYFTPQEIEAQILRAIGECREAIDIAVVDITSDDILNALAKAKERGVRVRLVVDRKRTLKKGTLLNFYRNEKCSIKVSIQKGRMRNNFAVFDCKLLVSGSYYWNKNVGKYDSDNVIFSDETKLLVKYQREFDRLFHEGITPGIQEVVSVVEEEIKQVESKPAATVPETTTAEKQGIASSAGVVIPETSGGDVNMNFEEFNKVFGMASELSDDQKEGLWNRCVGKGVRWRGKVNYIGWGLVTGWMMGITHGDTNVEVKLSSANKDRFSRVKYGNTVTYTGKLDSRVTRVFPYKLTDGDVLEIESTPPGPVSREELIANPYTVPVSQGPKKIFLVESFDDLDAIFGKGSNLSDAQKAEAWKKYEGRYVSWTGHIVYKNLNVASGLRVGIMQKERCDVELKVGLAKKDKILKFQDGEMVLYTGKLTGRCDGHSPYILEDSDIITIK